MSSDYNISDDKDFIFRRLDTKYSVIDGVIYLDDLDINGWVERIFGTQFIRYSVAWVKHHSKDGIMCINNNGSVFWYKHGKLHKTRGPAVVMKDGTKKWYKNGLMTRGGDRPAYVTSYGEEQWWVKGVRHRDGDKPAVINHNGDTWYYKKGKLHRLSGPAVMRSIFGEYWVSGVKYSEKAFNKLKR